MGNHPSASSRSAGNDTSMSLRQRLKSAASLHLPSRSSFRLATTTAKIVSTASSAESAATEVWSHGRRRLTHIPYYLPVDPLEIRRLDELHSLFLSFLNGHLFLPLIQPQQLRRILDVGTGSARWVKDIALAHPKARVIGVDISSDVFYTFGLPSNARLLETNFLQGLPMRSNSVTLVHHRLLYAAVPLHSWSSLLSEYWRVLKPGQGWVHICEPVFQLRSKEVNEQAVYSEEAFRFLKTMSLISEMDCNAVLKLPDWLNLKGFVDIHSERKAVRLGQNFGGEQGQRALNSLLAMLRGLYAVTPLTILEEYRSVALRRSTLHDFKNIYEFDRLLEGMQSECNRMNLTMEWMYIIAKKPASTASSVKAGSSLSRSSSSATTVVLSQQLKR